MSRDGERLLLDLIETGCASFDTKLGSCGADVGPVWLKQSALRRALDSLIRTEMLRVRITFDASRHYAPERVRQAETVARENGLIDAKGRLTRRAVGEHWTSAKRLLRNQLGATATATLTEKGRGYALRLDAYLSALNAGIPFADMPAGASRFELADPGAGWYVGTYEGRPFYGTGQLLVAGTPPAGELVERPVEEVFGALGEYEEGYPAAYQHVREETLRCRGESRKRVWLTSGQAVPAGQLAYLQKRFPEAVWRVHPQGGIRSVILTEGRQPVAAVAVLRVSEPTPAIRLLIEAARHAHARPDADGQGNLFAVPCSIRARTGTNQNFRGNIPAF